MWLHEQTKLEQVVELEAIHAWRRAIAGELAFDDETVRFKHRERFADGGLGNIQFTRQAVHRNPRVGRKAQRHDVGAQAVIDFLGQPRRTGDLARRVVGGRRPALAFGHSILAPPRVRLTYPRPSDTDSNII